MQHPTGKNGLLKDPAVGHQLFAYRVLFSLFGRNGKERLIIIINGKDLAILITNRR